MIIWLHSLNIVLDTAIVCIKSKRRRKTHVRKTVHKCKSVSAYFCRHAYFYFKSGVECRFFSMCKLQPLSFHAIPLIDLVRNLSWNVITLWYYYCSTMTFHALQMFILFTVLVFNVIVSLKSKLYFIGW